jgi:hypothetical protein
MCIHFLNTAHVIHYFLYVSFRTILKFIKTIFLSLLFSLMCIPLLMLHKVKRRAHCLKTTL